MNDYKILMRLVADREILIAADSEEEAQEAAMKMFRHNPPTEEEFRIEGFMSEDED